MQLHKIIINLQSITYIGNNSDMNESAPQLRTNDTFSKNERFHIREQLQLALINRYYGFEVQDNDHLTNWLKEYAADYSKAFDDVCHEDSTFLTRYKNHPEDALSEIESKLNQIHSHS
jgi:hypothetical protein